MKKHVIIISAIAVVGAAIGGYAYFNRTKKPAYDYIVAKRGDLIQLVSVTGRVKAAEQNDLAFERGGKIAKVNAEERAHVAADDIIVELENADIAAQVSQAAAGVTNAEARLKQYEAARDAAQAELEELKEGTRPETITISETTLANAQKALLDAQKNLVSVQAQNDVDLQNLYDEIPDILHDAYMKAEDAVIKQTDAIFDRDETTDPQLVFTVTDSKAKQDAETQRVSAGQELEFLKSEISYLSSEQLKLEKATDDAEAHLTVIRDFLSRLSEAVNTAVSITQSTLATYQGYINTGRTNVNTAIKLVNDQKQLLAAQKALNAKSLSTAEAGVNAQINTVAAAQADLVLKKAGSTPQQIAVQEATVKQAEANIGSQRAAIMEARANLERYRAELAKTVLRSPIDGIVTKQNAKVGEIIAASTVIASVISEAKFEIEASVPEADVAKIKIGDTADVVLDAYGSDVVFIAKVISVNPAAVLIDGVATYKTVFQFLEDDPRVKAGMTADVDVETDKRQNIIVLPQRTVVGKNGSKIVNVLVGEEIKEVTVETGLRGSDGNIEIISGVNEGDAVVTFSEK
ncbi:efflux RND transporter periplasmic adaptor subunit [Patescibacteria group bacterium]|nr:efflux RND transporter periplasmic adaptor subunit [Patescibacteria group bacterium]